MKKHLLKLLSTLALVFSLFFLNSVILSAQRLPPFKIEYQADKQKATNFKFLKERAKRDQLQFEAEYPRALDIAKRNSLTIRSRDPKKKKHLVGFGDFSQLEYYSTHNQVGAITSSTDQVWAGGSLGLNLSGNGYTAYVWDGGKVRTTHNEFGGRVDFNEEIDILDDHATHVTGTIVANGLEFIAQGMAYRANAQTYDFLNDDAEIALAAGQPDIIVSNHSYGPIVGWDYDTDLEAWVWYGLEAFGEEEDIRFGAYLADAQQIDEVVYNAPFYLPIVSAGNDRDDAFEGEHYIFDPDTDEMVLSNKVRDPDGGADGYDCLSGMAVAKNVLTVGAVKGLFGGYTENTNPGEVLMTNFSSWGPTDDGRIKPDLVAKGELVYSTGAESDTAYYFSSGTSFSAPMVTGSALLVAEHYANLFEGAQMRADALKALLIHTADESGTAPGPDYSFGWGLLNTKKAVEHLSSEGGLNTFISGQNLPNSNQLNFNLTISGSGTADFKATIAWTDMAADFCDFFTGFSICDEGEGAIINDLDIRLTNTETNMTYFPWILDPANPSAAATTGDNTRDNVEQIFVSGIPTGNYVLNISHKGMLVNNNQVFSLMMSLSSPAQPLANTCEEAIDLNCGDFEVFNSFPLGDNQFTDCERTIAGSSGRWFKVIGTGDTIIISTCSALTEFDTYLSLYEGDCGALTCLDFQDDNFFDCPQSLLSSTLAFLSEAGKEYFVLVSGVDEEAGQFVIEMTCLQNADCAPPSGLLVDEVGHATARFRWNDNIFVDSFQLRLKPSILDDDFWTESSVYATDGLRYGNLIPDLDWDVQVRSKCGNSFGDWSDTYVFTTLGAGNPYCFSYGISWTYWIESLEVSRDGNLIFENITGTDYGYNDFTNSLGAIPLEKESTYEFQFDMEKSFDADPIPAEIRLFFDWDNDQEFEASSSMPFNFEGGIENFSFTVPDTVAPGTYRLRLAMIAEVTDGSESDPCGFGDIREVEDYLVAVSNIAAAPQALFAASKECGTSSLSVDFQDNSLNSPDTWLWDFGNGDSSTEQNPSYMYSQAGVYSVSLIVGNELGADTLVAQNLIQVLEPLQINNGLEQISACIGDTLDLFTNQQEGVNWQGEAIVEDNGPSIKVVLQDTGLYQFEASQTTNGCPLLMDNIEIIIEGAPSISLSSSMDTLCIGESLAIEASGDANFNWTGEFLSNTEGATNIFTPQSAGNFQIEITSTSGNCGLSSAMLNLYVEPQASLNFVQSADTLCIGESFLIEATGADQIQWMGDFLENASGTSNTFTPTRAGTYQIEINGMQGNCPVSPASLSLFVQAASSVQFVQSISSSCLGESISLEVSGADTYQWTGDFLESTDGNTNTFTPSTAGTYQIEVSGLSGDCPSESASLEIVVGDQAQLSFVQAPTTICLGESASLEVVGASQIQWTGDFLENTMGANNTFTPTTAGTYQIEADGMEGDCEVIPVSLEIEVLELPGISLIGPSSNIITCPGESITLEVAGTGNISWAGDFLSTTAGNTTIFNALEVGTYRVEVLSVTGDCSSEPIIFNIEVAEPADISFINVVDTVCLGESVDLEVDGADNYSWNGEFLSSNEGSQNQFTPFTSGTFVIEVEGSKDGCEANIAGISIFVVPVTDLNFVQAPGTICLGESASLEVTGANTYQWNGDFLDNNTGAINTFTPQTAGTFPIEVLSTDDECNVTPISIDIIVEPQPVIQIIENADTICLGESTSLAISGVEDGQWIGAYLEAETGTSNTFTPLESRTYQIEVRSNDGTCDAEPVFFNIHVNPVPSLNLTATEYTACLGETINIMPDVNTDIHWTDLQTGETFQAASLEVSREIAGSYEFEVAAINNNCLSIVQKITLNFENPPELELVVNADTICEGERFFLTALGADQFEWTGENLLSTNGNQVSTGDMTAGVYTYTLKGIKGDCESDTFVKELYVIQRPQPEVVDRASSYCVGEIITLEATGASAYTWGGPGILEQSGNQVQILIEEEGNYIFNLTGTIAGCTSNRLLFQLNFGRDEVTPALNVEGTCEDESIDFTARLFGSNVLANVSWFLNDINVATGPEFKLLDAADGDTVYYSFNPGDLGLCLEEETISSERIGIACMATNVLEQETGIEFDLYPNPNKGSFNLAFENNKAEVVQLMIYDISGKLLIQKELSLGVAKEEVSVSLDHAKRGIHLVRLVAEDWQAVRRVVVQ